MTYRTDSDIVVRYKGGLLRPKKAKMDKKTFIDKTSDWSNLTEFVLRRLYLIGGSLKVKMADGGVFSK